MRSIADDRAMPVQAELHDYSWEQLLNDASFCEARYVAEES